MQIQRIEISKLTGDPANARKHPERNIQTIVESLNRFGQQKPVVIDSSNCVRAGNGTLEAARSLGWTHLDCVVTDLQGSDAIAYAIADNRTSELAEWDSDVLAATLEGLQLESMLEFTGFSDDELAELMEGIELPDDEPITEDDVPEPPVDPITKPGDLWILGRHRVLCGDSTKAEDVGRLMDGKRAQLIHADPPYGMGKEKDGVQNDNLYADKLDAFQMAWWRVFRQHADDNGSAYIWGNAEELWRLWYVGGLKDSERMTLRNQVIWDKKHGQGMSSEDHRMFPTATEHCLFFMLGEQGFNNNADNYWEGWDSVVNYLRAEKEKTGWDIATFKRLAGHSETSGCHWFDKSQWSFPTKEVYQTWQVAAKGDAFKREHDELKQEFYATRAYFDNTHENMTDVWDFPRVTGEERHGHATPKPVAMMVRAIKSSCPDGGIVAEPFGGSGSTLIGAEHCGRACYTMEISPQYVDVIIKRWENLTGQVAYRDGHTGDEDGSTSNNPAMANDSGTPPGCDSTPTANRRKSKKHPP